MNTTTKKNKLPLRRCLVTGESLPKSMLVRLVRTPDHQLVIDPSGKLNGRGAYVKKDPQLVSKLVQARLIQKHLGIEPTPEFIKALETYLHA
jgi:predicted RNA-binding protein YlxR (DUF448 family)